MKTAAAVLLGVSLCALMATAGHARVLLRNPQALQDWATRSAQSGVVLAIKFDKAPASLGWATSGTILLPAIPSVTPPSSWWGTTGAPSHLTVKSLDGLTTYALTTDYTATKNSDGTMTLTRVGGGTIPADDEVRVDITVNDGADALAVWQWRQTNATNAAIDTTTKTSGTGSLRMVKPGTYAATHDGFEFTQAFTGPPLYPYKGGGFSTLAESYTWPMRFGSCYASNRVFPATNSTARQTSKPCEFWMQFRRRFDANYVRPRIGVAAGYASQYYGAGADGLAAVPNAIANITAATYSGTPPNGTITYTFDRDIHAVIGDLASGYKFPAVVVSATSTSYNFPDNLGRAWTSVTDDGSGHWYQATFAAPWILSAPAAYSCGGSPSYTGCGILMGVPLGWKLHFLADGSSRWPTDAASSHAVAWASDMSRTSITGASFLEAHSDASQQNGMPSGGISGYCSGSHSSYIKLDYVGAEDQFCDRILPDASHYQQWPNIAGGTATAIGHNLLAKLGYGDAGTTFQPWHEAITESYGGVGLLSLANQWTTWMYHWKGGHLHRGNIHGWLTMAANGLSATADNFAQDSTYIRESKYLAVTGSGGDTYTLLHLTGSGITSTGATTATVNDGTLVTLGTNFVGGEALYVYDVTGNTISISTRGQYGTTAATHAANTGVQAYGDPGGMSSLTTGSGNEFFDMRLQANDIIWINGAGAYTVASVSDIAMTLTPIGAAPSVPAGAATILVKGTATAVSGGGCSAGQWRVTFNTAYPASDQDILAGGALDDSDRNAAVTTVIIDNGSSAPLFTLRSLVSAGVFCADYTGGVSSPFTGAVTLVNRDWRDGLFELYIAADGATNAHLINRADWSVLGTTYPHDFTFSARDDLHAAGLGQFILLGYQQYEVDQSGGSECTAAMNAGFSCHTNEWIYPDVYQWADEILVIQGSTPPAMPTRATGP